MRAVSTLRDGDTAFVALAFSDHPGPKTYEDAYGRLVKTADYWHQWLGHGRSRTIRGASTCSAAR